MAKFQELQLPIKLICHLLKYSKKYTKPPVFYDEKENWKTCRKSWSKEESTSKLNLHLVCTELQ